MDPLIVAVSVVPGGGVSAALVVVAFVLRACVRGGADARACLALGADAPDSKPTATAPTVPRTRASAAAHIPRTRRARLVMPPMVPAGPMGLSSGGGRMRRGHTPAHRI